MKLERSKIVVTTVIIGILLFIGGYGIYVMGDDEPKTINSNQIPVPKLESNQKEYESKLDAINDLKEVKQTNAPSIYDKRLLDSTGVYDADLLDKEKMRMVDSIYANGRIDYAATNYNSMGQNEINVIEKPIHDTIIPIKEKQVDIQELGLEHQMFFASTPEAIKNFDGEKNLVLPVVVDGTQTVKTNYRLRMRLMADTKMEGRIIPRNTIIYGFVSFKPNRAIITIENINHRPVKLKAHDLQDGSEGIYVENSFRAEATREVVEDMVQDINIAGLPQVGGVKKIFQRNNRHVKVTVLNNYQLILKTQTK